MPDLEILSLNVVSAIHGSASRALTCFVLRQLPHKEVSVIGRLERVDVCEYRAALLTFDPLTVPTPGTPDRADLDALRAQLGVKPVLAAKFEDMAMISFCCVTLLRYTAVETSVEGPNGVFSTLSQTFGSAP